MEDPIKKFSVAVLGATGMVGQRFITLLAYHPWFEITVVAASARSAGKTYQDAVAGRWSMDEIIPQALADLPMMMVEDDCKAIAAQVDIAFCALDLEKDRIRAIEEGYAAQGVAVISNNSAHRWTMDVPIIMPEINPDHSKLLDIQRVSRGWDKGLIAVKPNCSIQSYVAILTALKQFKPRDVHVTSLQAISGAGKTLKTWPEMTDNIIPLIVGEEEKSEQEPMKIWGNIKGDGIEKSTIPLIDATCIRVPVSDGHMASVSVNFEHVPTYEEIVEALTDFVNPLSIYSLPSAPVPFISLNDSEDRPQASLDRMSGDGMGISIGRIRRGKLFDWEFIALSHNTIRGAAGGAILCAELLVAQKYIK